MHSRAQFQFSSSYPAFPCSTSPLLHGLTALEETLPERIASFEAEVLLCVSTVEHELRDGGIRKRDYRVR